MSNKKDTEQLHIQDKISRRGFIQTGAAFVAAAGTVAATSKQALAFDCDNGGEGQQKPEHAGNGSDSDQGANSDALGCGRQHKEKPKLSKALPSLESDTAQPVSVARVKV